MPDFNVYILLYVGLLDNNGRIPGLWIRNPTNIIKVIVQLQCLCC